ncbi:WD domain, G-beta repeat containing protein, putative [Babesia bigemina]|uniref:WD domain, G-beta repeat containing protein, putative n=1 Tax=Babesia bigemina TaxID=5866 RepID=A0A061D0S6_BABBI|nr:WD domain, G-beta repeat containing protein, putative [Babesia bigemina]CDR93737.1 WD domain, G-beta repeat containing protein, putative [Babesia bigemina]|eukprot:XP_012765923.1 WD domain, G-beta repeat containing protein, putative [Babesia bigemina]
MGTYHRLSKVEGLREGDPEPYERDRRVKRYFSATKVVGSGKETAPVTHISFSPEGTFVSVCTGTKVIFYDYAQQKIVHTFHDSKDFVRCCAFRGDGKVAAVSDDGGWVHLIALGLKSNLKKWRAHETPCHALHFSCTKLRLMTGGDDGVAKLWDTVTGELVEEFKFHSDKIRAVSDFCGSEQLWVTGGYDSVAYLFDIRNNVKPAAKVHHGAPIEFVELSIANNLLLTAGKNIVKLWDLSSGLQLMYSFEPHQRTVVRAFMRHPIITASLDGTVRFFNYASVYQSDFHASDERYLAELRGDEFSSRMSQTLTARSTSYNSDDDSSENVLDEEADVSSSEDSDEPRSPASVSVRGKRAADCLSDGSNFVTPESRIASPDHFTPMSANPDYLDDSETSQSSHVERPTGESASQYTTDRTEALDGTPTEDLDDTTVSLRHVYRFNSPVTALDVTLDTRAIAIGLSSGEWIIRHNAKEETEEVLFHRKIVKVEEDLVEFKPTKLSLLDRLVKTFQYQAALDLSLSLTPDHVYNLVETLVLRGSLATAVKGKDEHTILPLLRFVSAHLGNDMQNTSTLLELAHAIIDNNQWLETCDNTQVIDELRKIPNKINFELFQHNILQSLKGSLDLILNRSSSDKEYDD